VSPYLARGLDHEAELGDLARDIHVLPPCRWRIRIAAQRELVQGRMPGGRVDAALDLVLGFEHAALVSRGSTATLPGQEAQRLEAAARRCRTRGNSRRHRLR